MAAPRLSRSVVAGLAIALALSVLAGTTLRVTSESPPDNPPSGPVALAEEDRLAISELLIGEMLQHHDPTEVCFISLGHMPAIGGSGTWTETPPEFPARFAGRAFQVKGISEMVFADGTVREKGSGRPGRIYYAWLDPRSTRKEVIFEAGSVAGGLAAMGVYYHKLPGSSS